MESKLSQDTNVQSPPVPLKTYQWEDLRRARDAGGYPWTHLLKPPLEGEITAEDIIRETTPKRSMSRDVSRSRTHSPDHDPQKILDLDSSPGSSRRHGEGGEDEGVQIPNFSKEVSLDCEDDILNEAVKSYAQNQQISSKLDATLEIPKNVSPKGILKRRTPEPQFVTLSETREKTKCCHPLVNKIKHLADKTLQKLDKNEEKSPQPKRKKNVGNQEIRQLKSSPGAVRRQKFSAIKLGDSDEMSKSMSIDITPPDRKRKEHIYEDIEESKLIESGKYLQFSPEVCETNSEKENASGIYNSENESIAEKKSNASQDPSLVTEECSDLSPDEHVMEKLHKTDNIENEAIVLDFDSEEPNIDEVFQNQLDEIQGKDSPNVTITEIIDEETEEITEEVIIRQPSQSPCEEIIEKSQDDVNWSKPNRWTSEGGKPLEKSLRPTREGSVQSYTPEVRCGCQFFQSDSLLPERLNPVGTRPTSRASNLMSYSYDESDHEYEIIEKPPPAIIYTAPSVDERPSNIKKDDELSSTTSLERKYLQHTSDEDDQLYDEDVVKDDDLQEAEALQKDLEERYFVNTPSTVSRTECEISTSQVDSSALENLPLKRENRSKSGGEGSESKFQLRIRESTDKLKSQAGKIKTKLQNIKPKPFNMPEKPKIRLPERPKFKMPERPKFTLPDRPKFSLPDRRKFSLPDRPKFKKINISEKLSFGDRKKFNFPERPKFNVPDFAKFKFTDKKVNFPSFSKKKDKANKELTDSNTDVTHFSHTEFETKTYPRLFKRKKKSDALTSSSPTLNREDTPPPIFTFTRVKKEQTAPYYKSNNEDEPREYGNINNNMEEEDITCEEPITSYNFDKIEDNIKMENAFQGNVQPNTVSSPDISPSNQEYTHVINEINNDEFFVRPRGISRENIQVREYLSDEIRQAFKIPKNALTLMGSKSEDNDEIIYVHEAEADPELLLDENEHIRYSNEDINDRDDGYYTFPPVRPNRPKKKKKEIESVQYIDDSVNVSLQFSDVDLCLPDDQREEPQQILCSQDSEINFIEEGENYVNNKYLPPHTYNNETLSYHSDLPIQSFTMPTAPKRKKKYIMSDRYHSSNDIDKENKSNIFMDSLNQRDDVIVYRTEHEYIVPEQETFNAEHSPVVPRRSSNRSRSSHGTSLCDDDRTSQGADSMILDTNITAPYDMEIGNIRRESPGYATVDKNLYKNKTPPVRRRKSHSAERKYYTVGPTKENTPDRPPRKKSSTSLMTLDSLTKRSISGDVTQYAEIEDLEEMHKDLNSGEIVSKMKDRPLPPPPRPPRDPKRKKNSKDDSDLFDFDEKQNNTDIINTNGIQNDVDGGDFDRIDNVVDVVEIEVSTQTDPLPDDVDFELGFEENIDLSVSSSLRDTDFMSKSLQRLSESPRHSRPVSRSDKSIKLSDPKIAELSKPNLGRTSPTVILVERRVSSPTRINEHEEMVTEASLTVQHIDIDESVLPEVPPLPIYRGITPITRDVVPSLEGRALGKVNDFSKEVQLDSLVTQKLQVKDLEVGRLNVSELQASKILVSDIEGMTLQVAELDSKSGHISVSGIEFSQTIIDEIVKKFAELTTPSTPNQGNEESNPRPVSREEETQTEELESVQFVTSTALPGPSSVKTNEIPTTAPTTSYPATASTSDAVDPPQRPPPPDLTPLLYSYLQDLSMPPASFYHLRTPRERPFTDFHDSQQLPPPPTRRPKKKPPPQSESSSDESHPRPSPRRIPPSVKSQAHEPTITEAGAQFFRVCHNSICTSISNLFHSMMGYISGNEDKRDVQMALVIFLVLIAGLIMFGLSDSRTIHHHHWEFFNPPDTKK